MNNTPGVLTTAVWRCNRSVQFLLQLSNILCWIHQILNNWWLSRESRIRPISFTQRIDSWKLTPFSVIFFVLFPRSNKVSSFSSFWGSLFSISFPSLPTAASNPAWSDSRGTYTMVWFVIWYSSSWCTDIFLTNFTRLSTFISLICDCLKAERVVY